MIKTGNQNFWKAQIVGWTILGLSNLTVQLFAGFPVWLLFYNAVVPMVVGFTVTTAYRYLIRKSNWKTWNLSKLILGIILSTFAVTLVFMLLSFGIFYFVFQMKDFTLAGFISNMMIFSIVILAWNMIYFCIHYFNNWNQAEIEKWKLLAEMKDAQLGSLKSQINPHFVFNTLNNIRALILEDKDKARDMLLNFSDLFRYALKNTDQSKVALSDDF